MNDKNNITIEELHKQVLALKNIIEMLLVVGVYGEYPCDSCDYKASKKDEYPCIDCHFQNMTYPMRYTNSKIDDLLNEVK